MERKPSFTLQLSFLQPSGLQGTQGIQATEGLSRDPGSCRAWQVTERFAGAELQGRAGRTGAVPSRTPRASCACLPSRLTARLHHPKPPTAGISHPDPTDTRRAQGAGQRRFSPQSSQAPRVRCPVSWPSHTSGDTGRPCQCPGQGEALSQPGWWGCGAAGRRGSRAQPRPRGCQPARPRGGGGGNGAPGSGARWETQSPRRGARWEGAGAGPAEGAQRRRRRLSEGTAGGRGWGQPGEGLGPSGGCCSSTPVTRRRRGNGWCRLSVCSLPEREQPRLALCQGPAVTGLLLRSQGTLRSFLSSARFSPSYTALGYPCWSCRRSHQVLAAIPTQAALKSKRSLPSW